jgi:hypothetical protein
MADFEKASRIKLRFDTALGQLSAEDLWDLPLTSETRVSLDGIARGLHKQIQETRVSFVEPESVSDELTQLRFDLVKHVIDVKVAERENAKRERERAARKQRILEIMAAKEDESLRGKSLAELEQELASL